MNGVPNSMQQMSLSQSDASVEEQRVVTACRILGDGASRRVGELVGVTDDKGLEFVPGIEL